MRDSWLRGAALRVGSVVGCCCAKGQGGAYENPVIVNELISHNNQLQPVKPPHTGIFRGPLPATPCANVGDGENHEDRNSEIDGIVADLCNYELNAIQDVAQRQSVASAMGGCVVTLGDCDVMGVPYTPTRKDKAAYDAASPEKGYTNLPRNFDLTSKRISAVCAGEVVNSTMDVLEGGEI